MEAQLSKTNTVRATQPPRCNWIIVISMALLCLLYPTVTQAGEPKAKINLIDLSSAPELTIFATLLNAQDRPVSPGAIEQVSVFMDGRPTARRLQPESLYNTDYPIWAAMVFCGYSACAGRLEKAQKKGFDEFGSMFRDEDRATTLAYVNNVRNLNDNQFVSPAEALAALGAVNGSSTAFTPRLVSALMDAVSLFQAAGSNAPLHRVVVIFSDGMEGRATSPGETERAIRGLVEQAKAANVRIYSIGFPTTTDAGMANLELISRKTGGTFRQAVRERDIPILFKEVAAEIFHQFVVEVVPPMKEKRDHIFHLAFSAGPRTVSTSTQVPFRINAPRLFFRWRYWGIRVIIVLVILLLCLIIFLVVRKILKKRKKKKELEALKAEGKAPPVKGDVVKMDAPPKADAKDAPAPKACDTCGRVMLPDWKACLFCAAGIGKDGGSTEATP